MGYKQVSVPVVTYENKLVPNIVPGTEIQQGGAVSVSSGGSTVSSSGGRRVVGTTTSTGTRNVVGSTLSNASRRLVGSTISTAGRLVGATNTGIRRVTGSALSAAGLGGVLGVENKSIVDSISSGLITTGQNIRRG